MALFGGRRSAQNQDEKIRQLIEMGVLPPTALNDAAAAMSMASQPLPGKGLPPEMTASPKGGLFGASRASAAAKMADVSLDAGRMQQELEAARQAQAQRLPAQQTQGQRQQPGGLSFLQRLSDAVSYYNDGTRPNQSALATQAQQAQRLQQASSFINDPRELAIYAANPQAWAENAGYALRPVTAAMGTSVVIPGQNGGRPVYTAPITDKFDDRFGYFDPSNPSAGTTYTNPRDMTAAEHTDRLKAERATLGQNDTLVNTQTGQTVAQGVRPLEVTNTPEGGQTLVLDPVTGQPVNTIAGPAKAPTLSARAQSTLEDYYAQVESLDSMNGQLARYRGLIEDGALNLGPVANVIGAARNNIGFSDANSINQATFRADLESWRNQILMLHKGVQTEGDAQRALNTIMQNMNDERVVSAQLQRLENLNDRAITFREGRIRALESGSTASAYSGGGAGEVVDVRTPAEAERLPPGTRYRAPNGSVYVRQ